MTDTTSTRRFVARAAHKQDCVLCRADKGIWRDPDNRRFYICDHCFAADRHRIPIDVPYYPSLRRTRRKGSA
ncbi:hypothetical protein I6F35_02620 [Bradyrhizobium sp. BRP22]|uniref:hypothetical protein n=1 Tax=Bradyrhizobium sp. BRP22 TaxID=2793821 RepID=UPI001CD3A356|nr:hypothetical protein [Bradyrhizobium sp. BRP22]MCA1452107.1 hypothetical protein [Bradyrhizobium sp. BRP22]